MDIMRTSKYLYLDENQHLAPWVTSFDIQVRLMPFLIECVWLISCT